MSRTSGLSLFFAILMMSVAALAHEEHAHSQQATPSEEPRRAFTAAEQEPAARIGRHGGRLYESAPFVFEAVFHPRETRVYVTDQGGRPIATRGMTGQVSLRVRDNPQPFVFALVPRLQGADAQSGEAFLAAAADVTRLRDGDMVAEFAIGRLPDTAREARFSQVFEMQREPLAVQPTVPNYQTELAPSNYERTGSVAGRSCGRSGCCSARGCGTNCQNTAETQPALAVDRSQSTVPSGRVDTGPRVESVRWATAADDGAIRSQRICPIMQQPLGTHGTPIKLTIHGEDLFVCCRGCVRKAEADPAHYLAQIKSGVPQP